MTSLPIATCNRAFAAGDIQEDDLPRDNRTLHELALDACREYAEEQQAMPTESCPNGIAPQPETLNGLQLAIGKEGQPSHYDYSTPRHDKPLQGCPSIPAPCLGAVN